MTEKQKTFVLTAVDGEKIINIGNEPFVIPEGQEGSGKTIKLELEMLESDFEFLTQELVDSMVTWNMNYQKAWKSNQSENDEPAKFSEEECDDMIELYRRIHAYFKPFLKDYELTNGNYYKNEEN